MPDKFPLVDRGILIFAIWAVFGFLGLGLFLEGMARDVWGLAAVGVGVVVLAFAGHIIVNGIFDTGFTPGETALGIGTYGLLGLLFVLGALQGGMTTADFHAGLTFFGVLLAGFLAYLFTRHSLRGAFSRFHVHRVGAQGKGAK
jgi:hypothetical protein